MKHYRNWHSYKISSRIVPALPRCICRVVTLLHYPEITLVQAVLNVFPPFSCSTAQWYPAPMRAWPCYRETVQDVAQVITLNIPQTRDRSPWSRDVTLACDWCRRGNRSLTSEGSGYISRGIRANLPCPDFSHPFSSKEIFPPTSKRKLLRNVSPIDILLHNPQNLPIFIFWYS